MTLLKYGKKDRLHYYIFETKEEAGMVSALVGQLKLQAAMEQEKISIIFASAPSQDATLANLRKLKLPWHKIIGFHMDEYVGLPCNSRQSFSHYIKENLIQHVPIHKMDYIEAEADVDAEILRYQKQLQQQPIDLVFLGVGENGHIAFNDPHVADFNDPLWVKKVTLDEKCRQQQVNDGCFNHIQDVPKEAISLSIPMLCSAKYMICSVLGETKREAVTQMIKGAITTDIPASILRKHPQAYLFLDRYSGKDLL